MIDSDDYILLSQLTHAGYCLRRVALVMNEQAWQESADTAKGRLEHDRVHMQRIERRGQNVKLFEYDVLSASMGIQGKCDCIEANADENGCRIPTVDFPVSLYPVEFKHGKVRNEIEYEIQLCAQAMCLEEMYDTTILKGAIFYVSSHKRQEIELNDSLRNKVREIVKTVRYMKDTFSIPQAEYSTKCEKCSIKELCMPQTNVSAQNYCKQLETEAKELIAR